MKGVTIIWDTIVDTLISKQFISATILIKCIYSEQKQNIK